jgi:hypothetical protein
MGDGRTATARRRSTAAALTALAAALLTGCGAGGEEAAGPPGPVRCTGTIGAEHVAGKVVVPAGAQCTLAGTEVAGRVVVRRDATLVARSAVLGGGLSARGFERVEIVGGRVPGRERGWVSDLAEADVDHVLADGRDVTITSGNHNADYLLLRNRGSVEVRGFYLGNGSVTCRGNDRQPVVRKMSAETPGVLRGQCSGLRNGAPVPGVWGATDF